MLPGGLGKRLSRHGHIMQIRDENAIYRNAASNKQFIVFLLVYFLFFDTHFQLPILAPFARSLGATPFLVGLIVGFYSFFNILGNLISGHLIDSRLWKKPVTAGILLITVSLFTYALAPTPLILLLVRALHGFGGGLVIPATMVYLTKTSFNTGLSDLSRKMSFYGISIGIASLTGPPLAGILALHFGYERSYTLLAVLMAVATLLVILFWEGDEPSFSRKIKLPDHFKNIMGSVYLRFACRLVFALMGATGTLASFLPFKAEALLASPALTGGLFATFAATAIVLQMFWPLLAARFKLVHSALAGTGFLVAALFLLYYVATLTAAFYSIALYGLGFGLLFPALLELVARGSQPEWKGLATGIFFVFFSLGVALVPPLGGLLLQSRAAISPFLTAAVVSLLLMLTLPKKLRQELKGCR